MSKVRQKIEELRNVSGTSIQNSIDEITTTIQDTIQPQLDAKVNTADVYTSNDVDGIVDDIIGQLETLTTGA